MVSHNGDVTSDVDPGKKGRGIMVTSLVTSHRSGRTPRRPSKEPQLLLTGTQSIV